MTDNTDTTSRLRVAYDEVQQRKAEAGLTTDPAAVDVAVDAVLKHLSDLSPNDRLKATGAALAGMTWIARMCDEMGIEGQEISVLLDLPGEIGDTVWRDLQRMPLDPKTVLEAGIGAGFFTALWLGWLLHERESED